uniref:Uncharacterized protein n=2 Tax=Caenorhabditis tropicalis TaxID=1561998 RepID=A0A1I7UWY5_9PELO
MKLLIFKVFINEIISFFLGSRKPFGMTETAEQEEKRKVKTMPGIGLPAGIDYPNIEEISSESKEEEKEIFWRKEVANSFEIANNGYSFYRIGGGNSVFAKDLSGYWYRLNNATKCFEFLFEGFKDTTDYTRIHLPPQAPTFVGFNYLHQAVFPMNDDGHPILPKDDRGKTIFPFYDGYPLFPVNDSGAICVPLGDDGKPVFPRIPEEFGAYVPCDITGRVVLPLNEKGEPIYPRDEEGNVLMPFIILEDGSRKRAVYQAEDGTPILPFNNGEQALEVHEGEVLFQYEYQHKMMLLAQYPDQKQRDSMQVMDEQFYQQHAQHYHNQMAMDPMGMMQPQMMTPSSAAPQKNPAQSLLLKQLEFMKKNRRHRKRRVHWRRRLNIPNPFPVSDHSNDRLFHRRPPPPPLLLEDPVIVAEREDVIDRDPEVSLGHRKEIGIDRRRMEMTNIEGIRRGEEERREKRSQDVTDPAQNRLVPPPHTRIMKMTEREDVDEAKRLGDN